MYSYAIPVKSLLYANYPPLLSLPADPEEGVSPSVQKAFASMMEEGTETQHTDQAEDAEDDDHDNDHDYEEEPEEDSEEERKVEAKGDEEGPSAGDVFALEMELNRENKKMMKVKIKACLHSNRVHKTVIPLSLDIRSVSHSLTIDVLCMQ